MMLFSSHILPLLSITSLAAGAALLKSRDPDALKLWEILRLSTFSPSGRPGSSPWSLINITITDPNTIPAGPTPTGTAVFEPSTVNCSTAWDAGSLPYNQVVNCTEAEHGYWTFEMLEADDSDYHSPTENFNIRFTQVRSLEVPGNTYAQTFVGTGSFRVGDNLSGVCGASGVCSFGLKDEAKPVLVNQTRTECSGVCDE
ncbi:hypothetical protein QBC33DRAFT_620687 [Phialemonium atrogriseum]|uniref:Uncharacterized protein n=1 Tax=Phialemonium atrogriseum TaxID=1093897 RepID=A0AAJ0C061_9PEZI|nr:uncharacterized protein QBC33DRAFT_620687 [Phialemonium atrogriseum]KAK1766282.1 hypothetical protein QBC33DRAFT_620687 [Phialemonium atrogriseum]